MVNKMARQPPVSSPSPLPSPASAAAARIRRFILDELAAAPNRALDLDTPLFESLLDSTSVLALVSFLEQEYQIEIRDSEVVPANFSTLRGLAGFVTLKRQQAEAPLAASG